MPHYSIPSNAKFEEDRKPPYGLRELDLEGYEEYEMERKNWQRLKYPEEYKRSEALREAARNITAKYKL